MEKFYPVTYNGKSCGKVSVCKKGLYYHFLCRCAVEQEDIYRLVLFCENKQENLGILVPTEDVFGLRTRIPAKNLKTGEWSFHIVPMHSCESCLFVPISPEEPFAYISRLKESFLVYQNNQPGIQVEKLQE